MNINIYLIVFFLVTAFAKAQTTNPQLLVDIQKASQAAINAYNVADLQIGMLVYNTNVNRIFRYTNTGFLQMLSQPDVNEPITTPKDNAKGMFTYTNQSGVPVMFDTRITTMVDNTDGVIADNSATPLINVQSDDVNKEALSVIITAYK